MKMAEAGRIALRVEGEWWRGYWAPRQDSMKGAVLLAEVRLNLVQSEKAKHAFMALMKAVFSVAVKDATGLNVTWGEAREAPEHERAGSA